MLNNVDEMGDIKIGGVGTPINDSDAANKKYVDDAIAKLRKEILGS